MPGLHYITIIGTQDGVNATFTLTTMPGPLVEVYRNGVLQTPGTDYTLSLVTITFTPGNLPQPGDILLAASNVTPAPPGPPVAAPANPVPGPGGGSASAASPPAVQAFPPHRGTPVFCGIPEITQKNRESLRKLYLDKKYREWPYRWVYPEGVVTRHVRFSNTVPSPAPGVTTIVAGMQVAIGYGFLMTHVLQIYTGASFIAGSGSITWTIDVNSDPTAPSVQGMPVQGFVNEVVPLGSNDGEPWPLLNPEWFSPQDFIRSKVVTTATIPTGAPNFFTSMFLGWEFPVVTLV